MDLLITSLMSGAAVGGSIAFISLVVGRWISDSLLKTILTLPLGFLFNWLLGITLPSLLVAAMASGFFALVILSLTSRPVVVDSRFRR